MNDLHNCYTIKVTGNSNKLSFHSLSRKEVLLWNFSGQVSLQEHRTSWPGTWISVPPNVVITCCCSLSSLLHPHEDCFRVVSPPACVLTEPDIVLKKFAVERSRQTFNSCALCIPSSPLIKRPSPGHPIFPKTIRQIVLIVFYVCVGMYVLFPKWKLYEICIKEC